MKSKTLVAIGAALALGATALVWFLMRSYQAPFRIDPELTVSLHEITDDYRKIIVLVDGADALDEASRSRSITAGRILFQRKQEALDRVTHKITEQFHQAAATNFRRDTEGFRQFVQYVSADSSLHDADKLAFLDLVDQLESEIPPGAGGRNSLSESLRTLEDTLQSIQLSYREEVTRIFSQFATRGQSGTREKWEAYMRYLRGLTSRDKILAELGGAIPEESEEYTRGASNEILGNEFASRTVALTFDDGPHPKYTEQVLAVLRKYGITASFFELGANLGTVDPTGGVKLLPTADVARKILAAGNVIANHSYSHRVLSKLSEQDRNSEIDRTNLLLKAVSGHNPDMFRAPYGASSKEIDDQVISEGMKSVMWTIDSLDWADPIPESIAMRVLHELAQRRKGIILFHDIHKQGIMALPPVIEELQRQDYTFLSFANGQFAKSAAPPQTERSSQPAPEITAEGKRNLYRESWAVVVGINDYERWPKLRYAVHDADSIEEILVAKFSFKKENIRKLVNGEATRQRIMEVLGDEFSDGRKVQREDRLFFFFAGHGATRTLDDGRQIGFIVPVDADPANYYSTAISMTALREASDLIPAKHIYFVMDSCYSGLALTRGGGTFSRDRTYLQEVTRRSARQILTAGGADQVVADDGPDGHSVFTWTLLQGLQGEADLDGNGVITASELGAYISPIVSRFAKQTPTVGNLVGSEGGEFIFELQPEPLTSMTPQLDSQAMQLNIQLSSLQKEIVTKQSELLQLQQSIQAESTKLEEVSRSAKAAETPASVPLPVAPARGRSKVVRAYDLDRQGLQHYREKQYELAERDFKAAVALKPGDPVLLNNLGFIYYAMNRYDDALKYLQMTLAADPRRKEAHGNIAELYLKLGRNAEAKQHYEEYLALYPTSPKAEEIRKTLATLN